MLFDAKVVISISTFFLSVSVTAAETTTATTTPTYGVDCSFPIHHKSIRCDSSVLGDRQSFYERHMDGCRKVHGFMCDAYEESRLFATAVQPQQMTNHSTTGYTFATLPPSITEKLTRFWDEHKRGATERRYSNGSTETNHWATSTFHMSLNDDPWLQERLVAWTRKHLEEWIGIEMSPRSSPANSNMVSPSSIQLFQQGAIIAPQVVNAAVGRAGRASESVPFRCIVVLKEDISKDSTAWPLEIYNRDGLAVNITLDPGRMLLFESATVVHGRPFPLEGKSAVILTIDFEGNSSAVIPKEDYRSSHDSDVDSVQPTITISAQGCRNAAAQGDVKTVKHCMTMPNHKELLSSTDENGWQAIHEAARSGEREIIQLLISHGHVDDINAVSNFGNGWTPLSLLIQRLDREAAIEEGNEDSIALESKRRRDLADSDPLVNYLRSLGAVSSPVVVEPSPSPSSNTHPRSSRDGRHEL